LLRSSVIQTSRVQTLDSATCAAVMSFGTKGKAPTASRQELHTAHADGRNNGITQAAWRFEDVRAGCRPERYAALEEKEDEKIEMFKYPDDPRARTEFFSVLKWQFRYTWAIRLMVVVTIIEIPSWCDTRDWLKWRSPIDRCGEKEDYDKYYLSGIPYLPRGITYPMEGVALIICAYCLLKEYNLQEKYFKKLTEEYKQPPYFQLWRIKACAMMLVFDALDMLFSMGNYWGIASDYLTLWDNNRLACLPRAAILIMLPSVLTLLACIIDILPEMQTVLLFFAGFIAFFAWLIFQVVKSLDDPDFPVKYEIPEYATIGQTFFSLYVAGICDEFVDVMLGAYAKQRFLGILWFAYLVVVHLLFLSLVLDTLCAGYMKQTENKEEETISQKSKGFVETFKELVEATSDGHGSAASGHEVKCTREGFLAFLKEVNKSPEIVEKITDENAQTIFTAMSEDEMMTCVPFVESMCLYDFKFSSARKYSSSSIQMAAALMEQKTDATGPGFWNSWFGRYIISLVDGSDSETGTLSVTMDRVLIFNLVFIVIESFFDLKGGFVKYNEKNDPPKILDFVEYAFGGVYLSECVIKITVHGWGRYLAKFSNKFDLFTTVLLLSTQVLDDALLPALQGSGSEDADSSSSGNSSMSNLNLSTYANLLRLFRLVRLIKQFKNLATVQFMVDCVVRLTIRAKEMITLLLVALMTFTMLSVQLWGGKMFDGEDCLVHKAAERNEEMAKKESEEQGLEIEAEEIDWLEDKEFALNTNDVATAFGFWFVMLLCEFKLSYVDLVWIISEESNWQWLILCLFWLTSVCIAFELVKAFTIEVYIGLRGKFDESEKKKKKQAQAKAQRQKEKEMLGGGEPVEDEEEEEIKDDEAKHEGFFKATHHLQESYNAKKPVAFKFFYSDQRADDTEMNEVIEKVEHLLKHNGHGHGHEEEHGHHGGHEHGHEH